MTGSPSSPEGHERQGSLPSPDEQIPERQGLPSSPERQVRRGSPPSPEGQGIFVKIQGILNGNIIKNVNT